MSSPKSRIELEKKRKRRYSNCSNSSSDSGDEWTPALETCVTKKKTNVMRGKNIYIKNMDLIMFCSSSNTV